MEKYLMSDKAGAAKVQSYYGDDAASGDEETAEEGEEEEEETDEDDVSGVSTVPTDEDIDEDDDEAPKRVFRGRSGGLLGYLGFGGKKAEPSSDEESSDEELMEGDEDEAGAFDDLDDDDPATFGILDDEEGVVTGPRLADDDLMNRLAIAYQVSTADNAEVMRLKEFKQALAMLGKVYTVDEVTRFYTEALTMVENPKLLASTDRDSRGLLTRSKTRMDALLEADTSITQETFTEFFLKSLVSQVDNDEAAQHFRALVEGAAEMVLEARMRQAGEADENLALTALEDMQDTKHLAITNIFIYARDLRRVLTTYSEKLTDEEADHLVRECRPAPKHDGGDGGLPRVYFHQYLTMLKDEALM